VDQFAVLTYFRKGGPVMWPLLILSITGLAFIIERFLHYHKASKHTTEFLDRIKGVFQSNDLDAGLEVCEQSSGPIASIIKAGLIKYQSTAERRSEFRQQEAEKAIEAAGGLEMARLERGLITLATIANIAPLLGFLGTVAGMIKAFDVIARKGLNDPTLVAFGISEALITTATGLIIAIPTLAFYNYFTSRVSKMVLQMQETAAWLLETIESSEEIASRGSSGKNIDPVQ
jgi:biopolymer transport protein ExbB